MPRFVSHLLLSGLMLLVLPCSHNISSGADFIWKWHDAQELGHKLVLRTTPISKSLKDQVTAAIIEQLNSESPNSKSPQELQILALNTSVLFVDLNADGEKELITQGPLDYCSPTGNCPFYFFQEIRQEVYAYRRIFRTDVYPTRSD